MTTAVICTPLPFVPRIAIPQLSLALTDLILLLFGPAMPVSAAGNELPNFLSLTLLAAHSLWFAWTSSQGVPTGANPQTLLTLPPVNYIIIFLSYLIDFSFS